MSRFTTPSDAPPCAAWCSGAYQDLPPAAMSSPTRDAAGGDRRPRSSRTAWRPPRGRSRAAAPFGQRRAPSRSVPGMIRHLVQGRARSSTSSRPPRYAACAPAADRVLQGGDRSAADPDVRSSAGLGIDSSLLIRHEASQKYAPGQLCSADSHGGALARGVLSRRILGKRRHCSDRAEATPPACVAHRWESAACAWMAIRPSRRAGPAGPCPGPRVGPDAPGQR
jgi:hypothetical protein